MSLIHLTNVHKRIGRKTVTSSVNLMLEKPGIVGLVGANGAGKTTLLKLIAGQLQPTSGSVSINGKASFQSLAVSEKLIFINHFTPIGNFITVNELFNQAKRGYPGWDQKLADGLLDYFDIPPRAIVSQLSKGKQSLVRSLLGLCSNCPVTLFDEPTNGMDDPTREAFNRALLKSYLQNPRLFLVSSHHLKEIENIIDGILFVQKGRLLLSLTKEEAEHYATGLSGSKEAVLAYTANKTVLFEEVINTRLAYAVVPTTEIDDHMKIPVSIKASSVAIADLFRYLSNATIKGGS